MNNMKDHTKEWWHIHFESRINELEKLILSKISDLEKLLDTKLESYKNLFETKIAANDRATEIASHILEVKLETMNNIRDQLKTQREEFTTKIEHDSLINEMNARYLGLSKNLEDKYERLCEDIKSLQLSKANLEGKATMSSVIWAYLFAGLGALTGIAGIIIGIIGILLHFIQ